MGGLHSWCLAAERPELVSALVVEDMAPDFRGRTTGPWEPWLHALPVEFDSAEKVFAEFGPLAGQYFLDAFDRTATGWRLHGHTSRWIEIAAEWGTRDYWAQWRSVRSPVLLIEAGNSVTPAGQMHTMHETGYRTDYLHVAEAGHLVHDEAPRGVSPCSGVVSDCVLTLFADQGESSVAGLRHQTVGEQRIQRAIALHGVGQPRHVELGPAHW